MPFYLIFDLSVDLFIIDCIRIKDCGRDEG